MSKSKNKLSGFTSDKASSWKADAKLRRDNREWLKKSAAIALRVLDTLKALGLSQKGLAERMNVSPQQINKIVKGHENLTLETITSLEISLGIKIIESIKGKRPAA